MCQTYEEQWDRIHARHIEFHGASRVVNAERAWAIEPEKYAPLRRAGEAVRYEQRPSRPVEDTREI